MCLLSQLANSRSLGRSQTQGLPLLLLNKGVSINEWRFHAAKNQDYVRNGHLTAGARRGFSSPRPPPAKTTAAAPRDSDAPGRGPHPNPGTTPCSGNTPSIPARSHSDCQPRQPRRVTPERAKRKSYQTSILFFPSRTSRGAKPHLRVLRRNAPRQKRYTEPSSTCRCLSRSTLTGSPVIVYSRT